MQAHPDSALAFQRRETRIFDEIDEATSGKDVWRYVHGTSYPAEVSVRNCEPRHAIRMTALGWKADVRRVACVGSQDRGPLVSEADPPDGSGRKMNSA